MPNATFVNDIVTTTQITAMTCADCGVVYGLGVEFVRLRRQDHRTWWCPNGHTLYFPGESQEERQLREAQEQLVAARALAERESRRRHAAEDSAAAARRQASAYKGHSTRIKRRVAHGVCPCCTRTLKDLARHMRSQHPDYVEEARVGE